MSDIRYNQWLHNSGTGGVSQDAGGNIGIGTTAPLIPVGAGNTTILNVGVVTANYIYGTVQGAIEGTLDDWIVHAGDTNTKFGFLSNDVFEVHTAGAERIRVEADGHTQVGVIGLSGGNDHGLTITEPGGTANVLELATTNASGRINFSRNLSSTLNTTSYIEWQEPGAQGTGSIRFGTSPSSNAPVQRLEITSGGGLKFRNADSPTNNSEPAQWLNHSGGMQLYGSSAEATHRNIIFCTNDRSAGERFRITSAGTVNIGGNFTQTTYNASITTGAVNKKISFGAAAHNDLSNEGSGIFFSRQNDGSAELSGLFAHSNGGFGISTREYLTFHTGGGSTYGAAVERLRITSDGWCMLNTSTLGSSKSAKELIVSYNNTGVSGGDQGRAGITIRSGSNTSSVSQPGYIYFSDGTAGSNESVGAVVYDHASDYMYFSTGGNERLHITSFGGVGIGTDNFASDLDNRPGLAIHSDHNDSCRLLITTPTKAPTRLGYFGLNRFGVDVHNGFQIRDAGSSYATRVLIGSNGNMGLGTENTNSRVTISSGSSANAISIRNTTGGNGNVGILFSTQDHSTGREKAAIYHQETHGQAHYGGDFIFCLNTATGGATQVSPSDERMRITRAGQLMLGGDGGAYLQRTTTNQWTMYTNSTPCVIFRANQRVWMPQVYSTNGSSGRDVEIESDGNLFAGNTSIRAAKKNITPQTDVSWLYDLNPVTFNYRKHTVDEVTGVNTYLEETEEHTSYGLIAEEVEAVKKDFCFYNKDEDGNDKLEGVSYKHLITPLLKALQNQKKEIDALKAEVATLKSS